MAVLMSGGGAAGGPNGGERRCDGTCHNAKHSTCVCICGGRYHGKSTAKAFQEHDQDIKDGLWGEEVQQIAKIIDTVRPAVTPPVRPVIHVEERTTGQQATFTLV